jgi:hypothetical protein
MSDERTKGFIEAAQRYRDWGRRANDESLKLINERIELDLKYQLACQKLSGTCDFCPAADLGCHGPAGEGCRHKVDLALEKMVKGEVIEG